MSTPVQYLKETRKLRPTADEQKSQWVLFHNDKNYLLPVVLRNQQIVPVFGDDGEIAMQVNHSDPQLPVLVDALTTYANDAKG